RQYMAKLKPKDALSYQPWRLPGEKLQTVAVTNFKGGSAKTTTTLYLAQYLALAGYRVLAIDLLQWLAALIIANCAIERIAFGKIEFGLDAQHG
ncbi:AAA family ATPase, partial [Rhizobium ruizarguesonis]